MDDAVVAVECTLCAPDVHSWQCTKKDIERGAEGGATRKENVPHDVMLKIQKKNVNLAMKRKNVTKHVGPE